MTLPPEFQKSYQDRLQYPMSLMPSRTVVYSTKLKSYLKRLEDVESDLCLTDGNDDVDSVFEVPIIDLATADGKASQKQYLHSPAKLTKWLGIELVSDPNDSEVQQLVAKKEDPKCRFIYLYGQHSRDKLKITRSSLAEILTYHQVMPTYLDFMLVFGARSDPNDLRFSGFREHVNLRTSAAALPITSLGRSGRLFQLCYNLKNVRFKRRSDDDLTLDEWSISQTAVYHQFDVENASALWIVTKGGDDLLDQYEELVGPGGRPGGRQFGDLDSCFKSSLATHLLFCHWSTEDWRQYIRWLEEVLNHEDSSAIYMPHREGNAHRSYSLRNIRLIQDLQRWRDRANEAVLVLGINLEILRSLRAFYHGLAERKDFPATLKATCEEESRHFVSQLDEIISDFSMQTARVKLLIEIISDRKELVLQYLQGQLAELNGNMAREAVVMRIVTIVTLIYLPATFTSTFFSTDVVKYQDTTEADGTTFSKLALMRWLQVTLPLTAITLFVAWLAYKMNDTSRTGMTIFERIKSFSSPAKPHLMPHRAQVRAQLHSDHDHAGDLKHRIARNLATFIQPSSWRQRRGSSLPLHTIKEATPAGKV